MLNLNLFKLRSHSIAATMNQMISHWNVYLKQIGHTLLKYEGCKPQVFDFPLSSWRMKCQKHPAILRHGFFSMAQIPLTISSPASSLSLQKITNSVNTTSIFLPSWAITPRLTWVSTFKCTEHSWPDRCWAEPRDMALRIALRKLTQLPVHRQTWLYRQAFWRMSHHQRVLSPALQHLIRLLVSYVGRRAWDRKIYTVLLLALWITVITRWHRSLGEEASVPEYLASFSNSFRHA